MTTNMRFSLFFICLFFVSCQQSKPSFSLVPVPASVTAGAGWFTLTPQTVVRYPKSQPEWANAAQQLLTVLQPATGFPLKGEIFDKKIEGIPENAIWLIPDERIAGTEGYTLEVKPGAVMIRAKTAAGAFYGIQTLLQLFPPAIFGTQKVFSTMKWQAPACEISDAPRFAYRGLQLDVGRHFFSVDFIKRYIDLMAHHKLNVFHWHLTDDQGWRIEIKKHPRLTDIGSYRKETLIGHYQDQPPQFDGKRYGGFYTQEEIKDVVAYAKSRFVTIVPEIELPGHALAALAAYPELGCTGGPYEVRTKWAVSEDVFCAGNEKTFAFWEEVLAEVCSLFPGQYVHIGGDECPKERWKTCPKCQKRIKDEKLADEHALQSYCIRRVGVMLAQRGKKLIGWDEILEGGLAPDATVMSWRGEEGGIAAAQSGHDAIMTPDSHCYFDYYQGDPASEPLAIGGLTTLEKVYRYEPIPVQLTEEQAKHILGTQGNVWTEYISTPEKVEYMAFPRACALAECAWSPKALKNWADFSNRMRTHFERLDGMSIHYAKSFYDVRADFTNGKVTLHSNDSTASIRYTTNGSEPHGASKWYKGSFSLSKTTQLKARVYRGDMALGKTARYQFWVHKATGKPYSLSYLPERYTGGSDFGLTNGLTGTFKAWNNWVGIVNHDLDPVIDLGKSTAVERVTTHYADAKQDWIYPPKHIAVFVSEDGREFTQVAATTINDLNKSGGAAETIVLVTPGARGRYVKLVAQAFGIIPEGAAGAGNGAWLFLDEVMVE